MKKTADERFWAKVNKHSGLFYKGTECWLWTAAVDKQGYGRFWETGKKQTLAHRYAYGPVQDGLELDHLCERTSCVRHTEAVTHRENMRRYQGEKNWFKWADSVMPSCHQPLTI